MRLAMIAVLAIAIALPAMAMPGESLLGTIPFTFEFAGKVMPAGAYRIDWVQATPFAIVRGKDNPDIFNAFLAHKTPLRPENSAAAEVKLVFNKYGDRYFLSQVFTGEYVYRLAKSRQERELVTSWLVTKKIRPETIVIAARLVR